MYDWANSAFAVVVLSGFFPILYRDYWAESLASKDVTTSLAIANSTSGILLMLLSVFLGAIADVGNRQKLFLIVWMSIGVGGTFALGAVAAGEWMLVLIVYAVATLSFMIGNIFYDAMIVDVSIPAERERVSSLGYAVGYLGGGLLLAGMSALVLFADQVGFSSGKNGQVSAMRLSFYVTGIWWLVFTLPLILFIPNRRRTRIDFKAAVHRFLSTFRLLSGHSNTKWFLLAYWLYIDGVDTVIRMAVDYGKVLGFSSGDLITALLLVQFIGFPGTLIFGLIAEKIGAKRAVLFAVIGYVGICFFGALVKSLTGFYMLAIMIALLQGGIQAQSRSIFSKLIPVKNAAQFFGLYNLLGRFSVVVGPLLLSLVGALTDNPRLGILSIVVLFILGGIILSRVSEAKI